MKLATDDDNVTATVVAATAAAAATIAVLLSLLLLLLGAGTDAVVKASGGETIGSAGARGIAEVDTAEAEEAATVVVGLTGAPVVAARLTVPAVILVLAEAFAPACINTAPLETMSSCNGSM